MVESNWLLVEGIHVKYLLYVLHLAFALLGIVSENFSFSVAMFELSMMTYIFLMFFSTDSFSYSGLFAFVHLVAASCLIVGSAKYSYFSQISDWSFDACLILISLLIISGIFPFSFWVSYCSHKLYCSSMLYLQILTSKFSLVMLFRIFAHQNLFEKQMLLFFGVATMVYAAIFIARASLLSVGIALFYVIFAIFEFYFLGSFNLDSNLVAFAVSITALLIVFFYKNEESRRLFAYLNITFAGLLTISMLYMNLIMMLMLSMLTVCVSMLILYIDENLFDDNKSQSLDIALYMVISRNISNMYVTFFSKFLYIQKLIYRSCINYFLKLHHYYISGPSRYLQIDASTCNILLLIFLFIFSSFLIFVYVF